MPLNNLKKELESDLRSVFPSRDRPHIVSICDDETPAFNEVCEENVTPEMFRCHDAFFWFTPDGFMYFFPALIRCTFIDKEKCVASIEHLLDCFIDSFGSIDDCGSITKKWEGFSLVQLKYILKWLVWLGMELPFRFDETYKEVAEILNLMIAERSNE